MLLVARGGWCRCALTAGRPAPRGAPVLDRTTPASAAVPVTCRRCRVSRIGGASAGGSRVGRRTAIMSSRIALAKTANPSFNGTEARHGVPATQVVDSSEGPRFRVAGVEAATEAGGPAWRTVSRGSPSSAASCTMMPAIRVSDGRHCRGSASHRRRM